MISCARGCRFKNCFYKNSVTEFKETFRKNSSEFMDNSEKKLYLAKMVNVWKHVNSEGKEMCGTLSSLVELLSPVCFDFSVSE